ncbi:hypothetical protein ABZP36_036216 [Zizania latifolia]
MVNRWNNHRGKRVNPFELAAGEGKGGRRPPTADKWKPKGKSAVARGWMPPRPRRGEVTVTNRGCLAVSPVLPRPVPWKTREPLRTRARRRAALARLTPRQRVSSPPPTPRTAGRRQPPPRPRRGLRGPRPASLRVARVPGDPVSAGVTFHSRLPPPAPSPRHSLKSYHPDLRGCARSAAPASLTRGSPRRPLGGCRLVVDLPGTADSFRSRVSHFPPLPHHHLLSPTFLPRARADSLPPHPSPPEFLSPSQLFPAFRSTDPAVRTTQPSSPVFLIEQKIPSCYCSAYLCFPSSIL